MTKNTLLFGNGINRTENSPSWDDILGDIFSSPGGKRQSLKELKGEEIPATLVYESLLAREKERQRDGKHTEEFRAKQAFVSKIDSCSSGLFNTIANLKFDEYMTTNYDYSLEECLERKGYGKENEKSSSVRNSRFSLRRKVVCKKGDEETRVWHIHGEKDITSSVMLGYDQYCRYLRRIGLYVLGLGKNNKAPMKDRLVKGDVNVESWVDLFFFTDVYIVGLGLGYPEIELWWLLCYRARLKPNNHIYFYDKCIDDRRRTVLESLDVNVNANVEMEYIRNNDADWPAWYQHVFDLISEKVNVR